MNAVANPSPLSKLQTVRVPLWVPLTLAVLLLLLFVWKYVALSAAEARLEEQRIALTEQAAREKAALLARANAAITQYSDEAHVLLGTGLSWAVRGEMIQGNLGQVDEFFGELVRNPRIQRVALADASGRILTASDRKLEGGTFSEHFPAELLNAPGVAVHPGEQGQKNLALPVQGLTQRLGTVIVAYQPEPALTDP